MKKFAAGLLIGIAIGGTGIGFYMQDANYDAKEKELAGLAVMLHVYDADFATKVLQTMDEGRDDTARLLLRSHRDNGLDQSYRLMTTEDPRVGSFVARQLLPGIDRTTAYLAETDPDHHLVAWSRDVKKYLQQQSVRMD